MVKYNVLTLENIKGIGESYGKYCGSCNIISTTRFIPNAKLTWRNWQNMWLNLWGHFHLLLNKLVMFGVL